MTIIADTKRLQGIPFRHRNHLPAEPVSAGFFSFAASSPHPEGGNVYED
ncbi:hypothetical protein [Pinisolibacter sp.]